MTYERCIPIVSQVKRPQADTFGGSVAAMAFADWSEAEAAQRIAKLLASGWSAAQIARMFGLRASEVDRLAARTMSEVSA
jgi:hypothetical protein